MYEAGLPIVLARDKMRISPGFSSSLCESAGRCAFFPNATPPRFCTTNSGELEPNPKYISVSALYTFAVAVMMTWLSAMSKSPTKLVPREPEFVLLVFRRSPDYNARQRDPISEHNLFITR